MFALIDCNNFYASCERVFRPDLKERPIVVLSNHDGCCIARSNEAKALGIAMGAPYFKIKALCKQHQVQVFSSNYTLYGHFSHRVMSTIAEAWPNIEIYSIDEAFLDLKTLPEKEREQFCHHLQKKILQDTGIPTSIGMGMTKTLAKAANHVCKKVYKTPVFCLNQSRQNEVLKRLSVADVWGVGRQWGPKLIARGIETAYDLAVTPSSVLKKQFNIALIRTSMELQGCSCINLEETTARQSIMSSKSFCQMQTEFDPIAQALSSYCARAVEKMRRQGLVAPRLSVFLQTNLFRKDLPQYAQSIEFKLIYPTDDLRVITRLAKQCLERIFKPGYIYKKAGVCLMELKPKSMHQMDLFHQPSEAELEHTSQWMDVLDRINEKYGRSTIHLAAERGAKSWAMVGAFQSPAYMTRWSDVPKVRLGTS